eukprot:4581320-Prymnesium_polylepis.1
MGLHFQKLLKVDASRDDGAHDVVGLKKRDDEERWVQLEGIVQPIEPHRAGDDEEDQCEVDEPICEHLRLLLGKNELEQLRDYLGLHDRLCAEQCRRRRVRAWPHPRRVWQLLILIVRALVDAVGPLGAPRYEHHEREVYEPARRRPEALEVREVKRVNISRAPHDGDQRAAAYASRAQPHLRRHNLFVDKAIEDDVAHKLDRLERREDGCRSEAESEEIDHGGGEEDD